jgi:hypothetical protein
VSVFVLPTPERRRALAGALWCTARWIRAAYPPGESRLLYLPYLHRVQVLRAPGEFDFDAYDRAAGRRGAFLARIGNRTKRWRFGCIDNLFPKPAANQPHRFFERSPVNSG